MVAFDNRVIRPVAAFESAVRLENFVSQVPGSGRNANKKLLQLNEVYLRVTVTIPTGTLDAISIGYRKLLVNMHNDFIQLGLGCFGCYFEEVLWWSRI